MRRIVQQMLKGEEVTFCEKTLKQIEKDKADCDRLLQGFKKVLDEKEYEQLIKYLDGEKLFYKMKAEDMFAQGLCIGILLGMETTGLFQEDNSIIYKIFYGKELIYERAKASAECEALQDRYYRDTKLPAKSPDWEHKDLLDLEFTNANIYIEKEYAHYIEGVRKGIILGVESAKVLQHKEE